MRSLALCATLIASTLTMSAPAGAASVKLDGGIIGSLRGGLTGSLRGLVRIRRSTDTAGEHYRVRPLPGALLWGAVGAAAAMLAPHAGDVAHQFAMQVGHGLQNTPLYAQGAATGAAIRLSIGTQWGMLRGLFRGARGKPALIDDVN
jgi:hypothetical protein